MLVAEAYGVCDMKLQLAGTSSMAGKIGIFCISICARLQLADSCGTGSRWPYIPHASGGIIYHMRSERLVECEGVLADMLASS